tara:strand:+ start:16472 stop:16756 length:285 start_codon:yes stop_codon:yes gene_type:complete
MDIYILPANKEEKDFLYNLYGEIDNPTEHQFTDYYAVNLTENKYNVTETPLFRSTRRAFTNLREDVLHTIDLDELKRMILLKNRTETLNKILKK